MNKFKIAAAFLAVFGVGLIAASDRGEAAEAPTEVTYASPVTVTVTGISARLGNGRVFQKGDTCTAGPHGFGWVNGQAPDGRVRMMFVTEVKPFDLPVGACPDFTEYEVDRAEVPLDDVQLRKELDRAADRNYGQGRCAFSCN